MGIVKQVSTWELHGCLKCSLWSSNVAIENPRSICVLFNWMCFIGKSSINGECPLPSSLSEGGAVWSYQAYHSCPYLMHMYATCSYAYNIYIYILSGKRLQFAIESMAIEIVDLPH